MDRDSYIQELETKNGYCDCSDLSRLFNQIKEAETLSEMTFPVMPDCELANKKIPIKNINEPEILFFILGRRITYF